MSTRHLPVRLFQALILITVLCAASPLMAQQATDSTRVAPASSIQASSIPESSLNTTTLGPRLSPQFESARPVLARNNAQQASALAVEAGHHTIVISTLALVLGVIVIVLLAT